jgi:TonB family protein
MGRDSRPMNGSEVLPRLFGASLLTAALGEDAMGRVFRAIRLGPERSFVRLRILESAEIDEDTVLDAIEENGEIHSFLKNPAIARGVVMDAVEGAPFIAWNEPTGRTLDLLIATVRQRSQQIPIEHALLIGEKVATALDHAYNTTVDGERTLHGLVWPGFVSISDDGEIRLGGFGLASGMTPSLARPRFARDITCYLAPEHIASGQVQKNSDVYSVGVILFQLLFGRLPSKSDALAELRTMTRELPHVTPELVTVLRNCLSPADARYQSSGELRRELGKILFSGPYAPSTFNLAFFLNSLLGAEIEAETRERAREFALDPGMLPEQAGAVTAADPVISLEGDERRSGRRAVAAFGGALLVLAAAAGTIYLITRRPSREAARPKLSILAATPAPTPVPTTQPVAVSTPASGASDGQFKDEVARRVAAELKRLETKMRRSRSEMDGAAAQEAAPPTATALPMPGRTIAAAAAPSPTAPAEEPTAVPTHAPEIAPRSPVTASDASLARNTAFTRESETPPRLREVLKPAYPPGALKARIGGTVVLRVLVSEGGLPAEIQVVRGADGRFTDAAIAAVQRWTFEPARRGTVAVSAWTTIPIPFEP